MRAVGAVHKILPFGWTCGQNVLRASAHGARSKRLGAAADKSNLSAPCDLNVSSQIEEKDTWCLGAHFTKFCVDVEWRNVLLLLPKTITIEHLCI